MIDKYKKEPVATERPNLAPYACRSSKSRVRLFSEKESATRRKRAAQNKAGRGGRGKQGAGAQGRKPIMVKTKTKKK